MTVSREIPERWLEGEGEWRDVALELKREGGAPEPAARARMLAAFSAQVASSEAPAPEESSAAPKGRDGPAWSVIVKTCVAALLIGLLATYLAPREDAKAPTSRPSERAVLVPAAPTAEPPMPAIPSPPGSTTELVPAQERKLERRRPMREPRKLEPQASEAPAQAVSATDPARELALLMRARRVLHADPARTLELTDDHRHDYPRGAFSEEREVLAIEALVRMGDKERARARMERFASGFPNSTHTARIRAILE